MKDSIMVKVLRPCRIDGEHRETGETLAVDLAGAEELVACRAVRPVDEMAYAEMQSKRTGRTNFLAEIHQEHHDRVHGRGGRYPHRY